MIKTVFLKNVQSHRRSVLNLHPGVNVIVGSSDKGKTTVLRGLRWLCFNSVATHLPRSGAKGPCLVKVVTEEGDRVVRRKGRENVYRLNDQTFRAVGKAGVPEEVQKALQITELNWQRQHDPHFMIGSSAGEVARQLNDVANLKVIDQVLSTASKRVRRMTDLKEQARQRLKVLKKERDAMPTIDALRDWQDGLEKLLQEVGTKEARAARLSDLLAEAEKLQEESKSIGDIDFVGLKWMETEKVLLAVKGKEAALKRLTSVIEEYARFEQEQAEIGRKIEGLETEWKKILPKTCPTCGREWKRKEASA